MTKRFRDEDLVVIRFGGGRNTRSSEDQINPIECADGQNFLLDPGNGEFRPREAFDLVGTVPNGQEIRGFVTLRKTDGTTSMLVQAGGNVYEWDGASFTFRAAVNANAKLRGTEDAFWPLEDKVLIADVNLADEVHSWDGTTLQQETFLASDGSTPFGAFRCKYIMVDNERTFYANIHDNGTDFEHLLVCSQRGDFLIVSTGDRPSSSLSAQDPWFLPMPQLRPINGIANAFGVISISQQFGAFEKLTGSDATDFALAKLHRGSGAHGDEAVVGTGNDVIYGAEGHIESLQSTDKFGDVETDDISFKIADDIEGIEDWRLVYNERLKRIYCFPTGESMCHVLFTEFIGSELSPWSKYTTQHTLGFQPTAVMTCHDPADDLRYVFMGDGSGNVYRMEGSGEGDAGSASIQVKRTSILHTAPADAKTFGAKGWAQFRKNNAATLNMKFLFAGEHVYDKQIDVTLPGVSFDPVYGGQDYYSGSIYYGAFNADRLVRSTFGVAHFANQWQVETEIDTTKDFQLTEVGIRYDFAG